MFTSVELRREIEVLVLVSDPLDRRLHLVSRCHLSTAHLLQVLDCMLCESIIEASFPCCSRMSIDFVDKRLLMNKSVILQ